MAQVDSGYKCRKLNLAEFHQKEAELVTEWEILRLMDTGENAGDVSSALAWDDLTGMRLDAGKVQEARAK